MITVIINDDYRGFVEQKLNKAVKEKEEDDYSINALFKMEYNSFCEELKKYCLSRLNSFYDACQACIDILIEQGIANSDTWADSEDNLYDNLYTPYYKKLNAIEKEAQLRQNEINTITGVYDVDGTLLQNGLQPCLDDVRNGIHKQLNFQNYIGDELWLEFCTYRREDKYSNENYISDGLTNAELFEKALEFIEVAENEIYKSAELQHSISSDLKNLLTIKKFKVLTKYFNTGNWIRIMADDKIYKLRLLEYELDFDNLDSLTVEFSDVLKSPNGETDQQSVISKITSIATTYDAVQKQASQGSESNKVVQQWFDNGLDATVTKIIGGAGNQTQTWDSHGMLFRKYDDNVGLYDDEQLKIVNSTIAITNDNWETVKTAVGAYYYFDPKTKKLTRAYGVNAEVLIGKLILGEQLGIYNDSGSLSFDNNGFLITNGTNSFRVNPNSDVLLAISNREKDVFWVDDNGKLHISGDGSGLDISSNSDLVNVSSKITETADKIRAEVTSVQTTLQDNIDNVSNIANEAKSAVQEITTDYIINTVTSSKTYVDDIDGINSEVDEIKTAMQKITPESIVQEVLNSTDYKEDIASVRISSDEIINTVTSSKTYQDNLNDKANSSDLTNLEKQVEEINDAVVKITPESITSTVTKSQTYIDDLGAKVDADKIVSTINQSAEAVTISANKISLEGIVTANNYFKINTDGSIEASSGEIGGWTIGSDSLYAGSGENCVSLSTGDSTYAIWAGAEESNSAPFRVAKDGTVYLTKLYVTDENGVAQNNPVDLRTSYWKVDSAYAHSVKSMSVENDILQIELYNGDKVNFKKAAANITTTVGGSGTDFVVSVKNGSELVESKYFTGNLIGNDADAYTAVYHNGVAYGIVEVGSVYNKGYDDASPNEIGGEQDYNDGYYSIVVRKKDGTTSESFSFSGQSAYESGYADGYQAAIDKAWIDAQITSVANTSPNTISVKGYARAYVDGKQVGYESLDSEHYVNLGQVN